MKNATPLIVTALLWSASLVAQAQTTVRLGIRGGGARARTTVDPSSNSENLPAYSFSTSKSAITTWQAGLALDISFGKLAFQPALLFSQKGEHFDRQTYTGDLVGYYTNTIGTTRTNWLEAPLNVVYTLHGDHGLQLFAGPYVALGVGGRQRGTTTSTIFGGGGAGGTQDFDNQISYGPDTNNQRLDLGANFGVGYVLGPVQVQLGYSLGLRNLHRASPPTIDPGFSPYSHDFNGDAAHNRGFQLTGTYFVKL
jgi:hypothetical protein